MNRAYRRAHHPGVTAAVAVVALLAGSWLARPGAQPKAPAPATGAALPAAAPPPPSLDEQLKQLRGLLPDQAHVMRDVGFHYSGLWLAAQKRNWPLARFYYDETRSHLRWAVRVRPVRKVSSGQEISLANILDALDADGGPFPTLKAAIEQKDTPKFRAAYKTTLEGCYACHKACEKSYLRPKVPVSMGDILNFDPDAKWPQ